MTKTPTSIYEIPLSSQNLKMRIAFNGIYYVLSFRWCRGQIPGWLMDILSDSDQTPIAAGLPIVTGADILGQLEYLNIGNQNSFMLSFTDSDVLAPPTETNLGKASHLMYGVYTVS
jgi:hypothetical protein